MPRRHVGGRSGSRAAHAPAAAARPGRPRACRRAPPRARASRARPLPGRRAPASEPAAVVGDLDAQLVAARAHGDAHGRRAGVAEHVGQRLLHDPVARRVHRAPGRPATSPTSNSTSTPAARSPAASASRSSSPAAGATGAAAVGRAARRASRAGRPAPRRSSLDVAQRRARLARVAVDQVRRDARLDVDRHHRVRDHVVDLARDPQALLAEPPQRLLLARGDRAARPPRAASAHVAGGEREQAQARLRTTMPKQLRPVVGERHDAHDHARHDGRPIHERAPAVAAGGELEQRDHRDQHDGVRRARAATAPARPRR